MRGSVDFSNTMECIKACNIHMYYYLHMTLQQSTAIITYTQTFYENSSKRDQWNFFFRWPEAAHSHYYSMHMRIKSRQAEWNLRTTNTSRMLTRTQFQLISFALLIFTQTHWHTFTISFSSHRSLYTIVDTLISYSDYIYTAHDYLIIICTFIWEKIMFID